MQREYRFVKVEQDGETYVALPDMSGMMPCLPEQERDSFMREARDTFTGTEQGDELIAYLESLMSAMKRFLEK